MLRLIIKCMHVSASRTTLSRPLPPKGRFASTTASSTRMGSLEAAHASPSARPSKVLLHCGERWGSAAWPALWSSRISLTTTCHTDWSAKESWLRGLREVGLDVELWPDLTCFDDVAFVVCWYVTHVGRRLLAFAVVHYALITATCVQEADSTTCANRNPPDELFSKVSMWEKCCVLSSLDGLNRCVVFAVQEHQSCQLDGCAKSLTEPCIAGCRKYEF